MGKRHGSDIIQLDALGTSIVVINSVEIAMELLDKRSSLYSDRPSTVMLSELIGAYWSIAFKSYGPAWRDVRKAFQLEFSPDAVKRFRDVQREENLKFLNRLLASPKSFMMHTRYMTGAIIMSSGYGIEIQSQDDPFIEIGEKGVEAISASAGAGVWMVDLCPPLKHLPEWFPGARFKRQAKEWRVHVDKMFDLPYSIFQQNLAKGRGSGTVAASLTETIGRITPDPVYGEEVIKSTLASLYAGGADTTVSAIQSLFLAMVLYPDIQKKAQDEIDRVIGSSRLPDYSDMDSLPYIEAVVRELLRWNPVIPLGVPHRLMEDDVYNGYFIPRGSIVVPNQWAMLHNEVDYPNPGKFDPDRFLKDGKINPDVRDPSTIAFGFGRRICPGRFMAKESMWLTVAFVFATFDVSMTKGKDGKYIVPDGVYLQGLVSYPTAFLCTIVPRSKELTNLFLDTATH
ncbi:hypothetical protein EIP91_000574 [Steccherinum ochraceum]|uniref:Cytochrome P450 n=1 Tax=Steccherinum ochraceum TaxID=92696 RepID=A0A4R0RFV6_9APHY|nr:hypothetical protein EIP91_000574 [Steccherinum ochraceum]